MTSRFDRLKPANLAEDDPCDTQYCKARKKGNNGQAFRALVPYFVSAALAAGHGQPLETDDLIISSIGALVHVGMWVGVVIMDMTAMDTYEKGEGVLQEGAFWTVLIAAGTVIVFTVMHILGEIMNWWTFNGNLLPPIVTSIIVSMARASMVFTGILLFVVSGRESETLYTGNAPDTQLLAAIFTMKSLAVALTVSNNRYKIAKEAVMGDKKTDDVSHSLPV